MRFDSDYLVHPILIDIFCTGLALPFAESTHKVYTEQQTKDAHLLMKYDKSLLTTTFGRLRCRSNVTPLYLACYNENVPLWLVRVMLRIGTTSTHTIDVNGSHVHILDDLHNNNVMDARLSDLKEMFDSFDKTQQ